jgi:hypothetical protein
MNRFARRISAAVAATLALLWVTASSASAVRVPLDQDVAPYTGDVQSTVTQATGSGAGSTTWLLAAAVALVVALVVTLAIVARGTAHRHQGSLSAS